MVEPIATPYFSKTMSRNRFQIIWQFLHFRDGDTAIEGDRLFKVRPVLDYLLAKFRQMFLLSENISIDEGMLKWRGRLSFKVYSPDKPCKYGIKSYILSDSATGYCFNLKPYCGTPSTLQETVVFLLDGLSGFGYKLYMDNFYNSVSMCELLTSFHKTNVCGTLRRNRGEPQAIKELGDKSLKRGETLMRHNGKVMVVAWRDKRVVRAISTHHENENTTVWVKQKGTKEKVTTEKPVCVAQYNKGMGGVDKLDQNISYYPFVRKTEKWTKKFVMYLIQISMFNALCIYREKNPDSDATLFSFIVDVVKSWTALPPAGGEQEGEEEMEVGEGEREAGERGAGEREVDEGAPLSSPEEEGSEEESGAQLEPNPRPPHFDPPTRLNGKVAEHVLVSIPPTAKSKGPRRKCRVCSRKKKRSETRLQCQSCHIPLHPKKCYALYHSKKTFWE